MKNLLSTALFLVALYLAFVWLTETELFSTDIRFNFHSEYSATLGSAPVMPVPLSQEQQRAYRRGDLT